MPQGGSSGSPVLGYSDHLVVALHHCANCPNRGVPIDAVISDLGSNVSNNGFGGGCVPTENPEATCDDGIDNDCDGLTDGADPDCGKALPLPSLLWTGWNLQCSPWNVSPGNNMHQNRLSCRFEAWAGGNSERSMVLVQRRW